ncbi:Retrovirus-related Pol polyprotein from transposon TNT 1-94 [Dendrobium catenatum]|uniref:Retrovirus-related Pol polyprotein from transposon TNT 1-94 n=1 Tax=Dendrobium catenatum TaxID=906689 RepID=A0A2I0XIT3_9ASPA|nr:Retrovirus-related Pol polyprotein from transposon TNT 1-94 [Dendrobium catenatum]
MSQSMEDQDSTHSRPPSSTALSDDSSPEIHIPPQLKFLISNIKNLVPNALTTENYAIWQIQLLQKFTANGYAGHLTSTTSCPPDTASQASQRWHLADNNLLSALFSTISPTILPYAISYTSAHDVWLVLERRLQPTCRSRVIQLKNELHHVQMQNKTMQEYLNHVKSIVDNISASGSNVDTEDVILHILNGLPSTYNSFKDAIRTSPLPMTLDNLYSLLCSEEINVNQEISRDASNNSEQKALSAATSDVIWLHRLAAELDLPQNSPTQIYCDNTSAIALARNPVFHARTKHIEIDYQFIRQHLKTGAISLSHIPSEEQIADILTKSFSTARFHNLLRKLTICSQND